MKPVTIELSFKGLPPNPNVTTGMHWSKTHKSKQLWATLVATEARQYMQLNKLKGLMDQARIHYHISVGDNRVHDADNIIASLKPVQDGLKGTVIVDDSIDHIEVSYTFDRAKPRGFIITLEEMSNVK